MVFNSGNIIRGPRKPAVAIDGARLSEIRIEAGLSLSDVAKKMGCNRATISRWEQGKRHPSLEDILALILVFWPEGFLIETHRGLLDKRGAWKIPGVSGGGEKHAVTGSGLRNNRP